MDPIHPAPRDEEAALVERLVARDDQAFEQLLRSEGARLMAAARRILGNVEDAQDAVQEGLLAAMRGLDRFDGRSRLGTWLFRIVMNHALMALRKRKTTADVDIEDVLPSFTDYGHHERPVRDLRPETRLETEETRQTVRDHIERLPDSYRIPLILRDIEERPLTDVAELLGISANAVKIRVHRARQALRQTLSRTQEAGA